MGSVAIMHIWYTPYKWLILKLYLKYESPLGRCIQMKALISLELGMARLWAAVAIYSVVQLIIKSGLKTYNDEAGLDSAAFACFKSQHALHKQKHMSFLRRSCCLLHARPSGVGQIPAHSADAFSLVKICWIYTRYYKVQVPWLWIEGNAHFFFIIIFASHRAVGIMCSFSDENKGIKIDLQSLEQWQEDL